MLRDCPKRTDRQVQDVTADEQPETLFIGHTEAVEVGKQSCEVKKGKCCKDKVTMSPGLSESIEKNRFDALAKKDDEEDLICETFAAKNGTKEYGFPMPT